MENKIYSKSFFKWIFLILFSFLSPFPNLAYAFESSLVKEDIKLTIKNNEENIKSEYLLGAGDELFILFNGLSIYSGTYIINPEGELFLPELKNVKASNFTVQELTEKINYEYQKFIKNPEISIKIKEYRPVNFYISGEVKNPGLYQLNYLRQESDQSNKQEGLDIFPSSFPGSLYSNSPKLFNAIKIANGVTNKADLSRVKIIRNQSINQGNGKIKAEVNLLELLINGDQSQNIRILDGDNIIIPKSSKLISEQILAIKKSNLNPDKITVYITGNVSKKGAATLPKGASLNESIASTGGKKLMTGNIELIRFKDDGATIKKTFKYDEMARVNSPKNPILEEGDIINVRRTLLGITTEVVDEISNPVLSGYGLFKLFN